MKKIISFLLLLFTFYSCHQKESVQTNAPTLSRDSLIYHYIDKTFAKGHSRRWKNDFENYHHFNFKHPRKEIIIYPGPYKLRKYEYGDGQSYSQFAVEFTTLEDSLITLFGFADELYYLYNANGMSQEYGKSEINFRPGSSISEEILIRHVNLESNLNNLIDTLGYSYDKKAILNLMSVLFDDVLEMKPVDWETIGYIKSRIDTIKSNDGRWITCKKEFDQFIYDFHPYLNFQTREGDLGYWNLKLENQNGKYCVDVKFIGDLTFNNIYM